MKGCWASVIGGCGGGFTKEHLPSAGFFSDGPITVGGWGRTERKIPKSSAGTKILCKRHNEQQPADEEGKRFSDATKRVWSMIRGGTFRNDVIECTFDGPLLERYFLKATIGAFIRNFKEAQWAGDLPVTDPPRELVEAAYGIRPLQYPMGLYAIQFDVPVPAWIGVFNPLLQCDGDGTIRAARIECHSFYFLIWLRSDRAPSVATDDYTVLADTTTNEMGKKIQTSPDQVRLTYHQPGVVLDSPTMRAVFHFRWPGLVAT